MATQPENDAGAGPNSAGNNSTNQGGNRPTRAKKTRPPKKSPKKKRGGTEKKQYQLAVTFVPKVPVQAFVLKPIKEENSVNQFDDWLETAAGLAAKQSMLLWSVLTDSERPFVAPLKDSFFTVTSSSDSWNTRQKLEWTEENKIWKEYEKFYKSLYALLWACCSPTVQIEVK